VWLTPLQGYSPKVLVVLLMFLVKGSTSFQVLPVKVGSLVQDTSDKGELLFRIFLMKGLLRSGGLLAPLARVVFALSVLTVFLAWLTRRVVLVFGTLFRSL